MTETLTDEQLVEAALRENPAAFDEIVNRWERKIFALCFGMLNREEDARDAVQETFISAYKNLASFRGEAKVSSWLHRIAVNQCISKQRWRKSRSESFLEDETENLSLAAPKKFSPLKKAEQNERVKLIRQAVNSLPYDLKEVIIMKEFQEMTFQEISETLETPLSTVKSRVYSALKQLKKKLEKTPIEIV